MISPPSRPTNSSSRLLNWPRPVSAATSPDAPPSHLATELPRPERLIRAVEPAEAGPQGFDLRNQSLSCIPRMSSAARTSAGFCVRVDADRAGERAAGDAEFERVQRQHAVLQLDVHTALVQRQARARCGSARRCS